MYTERHFLQFLSTNLGEPVLPGCVKKSPNQAANTTSVNSKKTQKILLNEVKRIFPMTSDRMSGTLFQRPICSLMQMIPLSWNVRLGGLFVCCLDIRSVSPTIDEYCMFHARASALRSVDLSRQVGSIIATDNGEILSTGCNEVPYPGGGSIWESQINENRRDNRDFIIGYDFLGANGT